MSQMLNKQRTHQAPWMAGRTPVSTPNPRPKNSDLGQKIFRSVVGREKAAKSGEEWELIQQARAGDTEALSLLFTRNRTRLYRTAYSLLRNKEDAEDALQCGLLRAYLHLESFEGRARFSTWLTRIVINSALMDRRRINAHSPLPLEECISGDDLHGTVMVIEGGADPEQLFAQTQTWTMVEKGIKQLPTKLRSALILRDLQDLSSREAATAARVNVGAMKSRLLRARRRLATLVAARNKSLRPSRY